LQLKRQELVVRKFSVGGELKAKQQLKIERQTTAEHAISECLVKSEIKLKLCAKLSQTFKELSVGSEMNCFPTPRQRAHEPMSNQHKALFALQRKRLFSHLQRRQSRFSFHFLSPSSV
jgi:hypothetical protein